MIEELRAFGSIQWVVAYTMEGKAATIVHGTIDDVAKFIGREDETPFSAEEWLEDFADDDNWNRDEGDEPFEFYLPFGEIAAVRVTRITGDDFRNNEDLRQLVAPRECRVDVGDLYPIRHCFAALAKLQVPFEFTPAEPEVGIPAYISFPKEQVERVKNLEAQMRNEESVASGTLGG